MTKKDYERAASLIQEERRVQDDDCTAIVNLFVDFFRSDNGRFDADRFRRACVPGSNVRARS